MGGITDIVERVPGAARVYDYDPVYGREVIVPGPQSPRPLHRMTGTHLKPHPAILKNSVFEHPLQLGSVPPGSPEAAFNPAVEVKARRYVGTYAAGGFKTGTGSGAPAQSCFCN